MRARVMLVFVCMIFFCSCGGEKTDPNNQGGGFPMEGFIASQGLTDEPTSDVNAVTALIDFHMLLNQTKYDQATALYGGQYELLYDYNPAIGKEDKWRLLQAACEFNGFRCLKLLSSKLVEVNDQHVFVYEVEFANPDGSPFELGPCCGASEESMPPISTFTVHVYCESDDICLVMDLPPYVP